jgi:hypothetical protein
VLPRLFVVPRWSLHPERDHDKLHFQTQNGPGSPSLMEAHRRLKRDCLPGGKGWSEDLTSLIPACAFDSAESSSSITSFRALDIAAVSGHN